MAPDDDDVTIILPEDVGNFSVRAKALETFLDLLTRGLNFQEFAHEVLATVVTAAKAEAGSILEVDYPGERIFFRAAIGHASAQVMDFEIPLGQGIVGHVVESRMPYHVGNAAEDREHLSSISHAVGYSVRNMVALPLEIRGKVYGVVELINKLGGQDFSEEDVAELTRICTIASKTIETRLMIGWATKRAKQTKEAA